MTTDDVTLLPIDQCGTHSRHRSFFLKWLVINQEANSWTACREGETLEQSSIPTWDVFIKPSPQVSGIYMEEEVERL